MDWWQPGFFAEISVVCKDFNIVNAKSLSMRKSDLHGIVEMVKAWMVAMGDAQVERVAYFESFPPTAASATSNRAGSGNGVQDCLILRHRPGVYSVRVGHRYVITIAFWVWTVYSVGVWTLRSQFGFHLALRPGVYSDGVGHRDIIMVAPWVWIDD